MSKNLRGKCSPRMLAASQELFDHAKQSARDTFKTTSKKKLTQKNRKKIR